MRILGMLRSDTVLSMFMSQFSRSTLTYSRDKTREVPLQGVSFHPGWDRDHQNFLGLYNRENRQHSGPNPLFSAIVRTRVPFCCFLLMLLLVAHDAEPYPTFMSFISFSHYRAESRKPAQDVWR